MKSVNIFVEKFKKIFHPFLVLFSFNSIDITKVSISTLLLFEFLENFVGLKKSKKKFWYSK